METTEITAGTGTVAERSTPRVARNYLTNEEGLSSWLLTVDHKRIALLYLVSVSFFFLVGGLFAMCIRMQLLTPEGSLMSSDTYNKVFTMHGVVMIFFVLIPSVPAVLGNFFIPMMLGARDLAFPRINLLSWYCYVLGALLLLYTVVAGGVDTGWTFTAPLSTRYVNTNVITAGLAAFMACRGGMRLIRRSGRR
jgi:cytochrome c oxidase subunit 1